MSSPDLRREFEDILYHEAWLLDNDRLEEWLDFFSDNAKYWAPVRADMGRGKEDFTREHLLAHFDDTKEGLGIRVNRIKSGFAHADEPPSRVRHFVSNVRILNAEGPDSATVASNFMIFKSRAGRDEHIFVGCREDRWRRIDGRWKIEERRIILDHNVVENLTVFI